MAIVYLLLGSNIGDRIFFLKEAENHLENKLGKIVHKSSLYNTQSWGNSLLADFLNKVVVIESELNPQEILETILAIENILGRKRTTTKCVSRTIDIDILFYDNMVIKTKNLTIPHPLIQERKFVLAPMLEIDPDFIHPVLMKRISEIYSLCKDSLKVERIAY